MKLLILCVDGFDPDYARENGFDRLKYSKKLTIPRECYVPGKEGMTPHTDRVWPSMFSGQVIDYGVKRRGILRQLAHDVLVKIGATWQGKPAYTLAPANEELDTIFKDHISFLWNIPTISPEWINHFPTMEKFYEYCQREYMTFSILARGLPAYPHDVAAVYTRILDAWGHREDIKSWSVDHLYLNISDLALKLATNARPEIMLISDHGTRDGEHTDHAYAGATFPFEAESVTDIRQVIEERLNGAQSMEETTN